MESSRVVLFAATRRIPASEPPPITPPQPPRRKKKLSGLTIFKCVLALISCVIFGVGFWGFMRSPEGARFFSHRSQHSAWELKYSGIWKGEKYAVEIRMVNGRNSGGTFTMEAQGHAVIRPMTRLETDASLILFDCVEKEAFLNGKRSPGENEQYVLLIDPTDADQATLYHLASTETGIPYSLKPNWSHGLADGVLPRVTDRNHRIIGKLKRASPLSIDARKEAKP
jgi:hypothetical protein